MTLQLACFKHLRAELANILSLETCTTISTDEEFNETTNNEILNNSGSMIENNDTVNFKLQQWIQQHTYLLRLSRDFLDLYTPVLIFYFGNALIGDCFGIFNVTQDQAHFFSIAEKILIGSYFIQNCVSLTIICIVATHLNDASKNVMDDGYHGKWYDCNIPLQKDLLVVGARVQCPVKITPKCSETAELSIDTLIFIVRTMISLYIALTEIRTASPHKI
nr:olfactory receptor 2 [Matsumurasca onukii]